MKFQVLEAYNKKDIGLEINLPTIVKSYVTISGRSCCNFKETVKLNGKEYNATLSMAHVELNKKGEVTANYTDSLSLRPVIGCKGGTVFNNVKILTGDYIDER